MDKEITLKEIMAFFGMASAEFAKEWRVMTPGDKAQIKSGLANGSLTY